MLESTRVDSAVVVGVLIRIDSAVRATTIAELEVIDQVKGFEVGDPLRYGLLIESTSLSDALERLENQVAKTAGVLGYWPVFHYDGSGGGTDQEWCTGSNNVIEARENCEDGRE